MRKGWVAALLGVVLLTACSGGKKSGPFVDETLSADSAMVEDAYSQSDDENAPMPMAADELFDDFFFNYASNRRQQMERTVFPMKVVDRDSAYYAEKSTWKTETFFVKDDYYTLFFDSPDQIELMSDTAVDRVVVERFDMENSVAEQFMFSRESGRWMLHEKRYQPLMRNPNAQFLQFFSRFVSDSLFQTQSLAEQIAFTGPDPDDDFATIEGVITPEFWDAFRPEMPQGKKLYNIVYGNQNPATLQKTFVMRGISNGLEMEMTFRLKRGRWVLTKLNT